MSGELSVFLHKDVNVLDEKKLLNISICIFKALS